MLSPGSLVWGPVKPPRACQHLLCAPESRLSPSSGPQACGSFSSSSITVTVCPRPGPTAASRPPSTHSTPVSCPPLSGGRWARLDPRHTGCGLRHTPVPCPWSAQLAPSASPAPPRTGLGVGSRVGETCTQHQTGRPSPTASRLHGAYLSWSYRGSLLSRYVYKAPRAQAVSVMATRESPARPTRAA